MNTRPERLPLRIAHPVNPALECLNDSYFELLRNTGHSGLYLQDSPFDTHTGRSFHLDRDFHLISLYEIAYGGEREQMRGYIKTVCERAARHGLGVHLCLWEPRLPYYAWGNTPFSWRGRGGYEILTPRAIPFCWSEPDAVAYWKQMARDAFAALTGLAGCHIGVQDNEAALCTTECPRCNGQKQVDAIKDIYQTLGDIQKSRPGFLVTVYDWEMPEEVLSALPTILKPEGTAVISRSSKEQEQTIDGERVPGKVFDMTMVLPGVGPYMRRRLADFVQTGTPVVDMAPWSRAIENWWFPALPDPLYALEKLDALHEAGAKGWYDFDCGGLEAGSIAEAIRVWTRYSDLDREGQFRRVLADIWGQQSAASEEAYRIFRESCGCFPIALDDPSTAYFSGRAMALGTMVFAPLDWEDIVFYDASVRRHWFAPPNFTSATLLASLEKWLPKWCEGRQQAWKIIEGLASDSAATARERAAFEIHSLAPQGTLLYLKLARIKLDWLEKRADDATTRSCLKSLAIDANEHLGHLESWMERNPGEIRNSCWHLTGSLSEIWPHYEFTPELLAPRRHSIAQLVHVEPSFPRPEHLRTNSERYRSIVHRAP